jgi:hypothetical protein
MVIKEPDPGSGSATLIVGMLHQNVSTVLLFYDKFLEGKNAIIHVVLFGSVKYPTRVLFFVFLVIKKS